MTGSQGSPIDLTQHRRTVILNTNSGQTAIQTLDIFYLLKSKLGAFAGRRTDRDLIDIQYILRNFAEEVRGIRSQLDSDNVEIFLSELPSGSKQTWTEFFSQS